MLRKVSIISQFPWQWVLWWLLIPNIAIILLWPIGGPPMGGAIFLSGVIAAVISQIKSRWIKGITVSTIIILTMCGYISKAFNLGMLNFSVATGFINEVRPAQAPEYIIAILIVVFAMAIAVWKAPTTPAFSSRFQWLLALFATSLLVHADSAATAATRGGYKASPAPGTPIEAAVLSTGITPQSVTARNLVIIVVEALGQPTNPEDLALFSQSWDRPEWKDRYTVSSGSVKYFGSTTNAELRELCGVWKDYTDFDFSSAECMPKKFADAGFHTTAMHAFSGDFFERTQWYPKLGFKDMLFSKELVGNGAGECGGVFSGACDLDVAAQIPDQLRKGDGRSLVYWLTLNSHLPVVSERTLRTESCDRGTAEWQEAFPMLCRLYTVHGQLSDAITAQVMADDFPESDILIVGDHMPPFFQRYIRTRFDAGRVPWVYLRNTAAIKKSTQPQLP